MKKAYIIDTNLLAIYGQDVSSKHIEQFFNRLISDEYLVILSTNAWYDQAAQIASLLKVNNMNIVSGGGSCFKLYNQEQYIYESFLNRDTVDLILHMAITSQAGVLVKGQLRTKPGTNVLLNYFLNVNTAKEFKSIWKFEQTINNDYLSFVSQLKQIDVSEIYIYSYDPNFMDKFLKPDKTFNDLLNGSNIKINEFYNNTFLFNSQNASKFQVISKYLNQQNIPLGNATYISFKEFDEEGKKAYGRVIVFDDLDKLSSSTNTISYDTKRLDDVLDN